MPSFQREHIVVTDRMQKLPYTSVSKGRSKVQPKPGVNRNEHGPKIREEFAAAVQAFSQAEDPDFVYLTFKSELDFLLDIDKFGVTNFRLASYKKIELIENDITHAFYEATVFLNKAAISKFLNKLEDYISRNTPIKLKADGSTSGGNPLNQTLISNIAEVRAATLQSFWQEPELPFPNNNEEVWWEVWLSRAPFDNIENPIEGIMPALEAAEVHVGDRFLKFPEHWVYLLRGSVEQLAASVLYTDKLAEIRKPKDTADFFVYLDKAEQGQLINDLRNRVDHYQDSSISVCLLDTGVNRVNPLLENLIPERHLDAIDPAWTKADTYSQQGGHGTPMAGLILYGDLTETLGNANRVQIFHHLESVKLLSPNVAHDPYLYGAITQEAVARGVVINPNNKRIVCMAVTGEQIHRGRPSSWSSAIDQIVFGSVEEPNNNLLFFISSGNMPIEAHINYPLSNDDISIQDPAQSFNAITVGAYTLKDQIDLAQFPGANPLAARGKMSACNTTSITWFNDWSRKPDIVMEGGNYALQNNAIIEPDSLQLLSASKGGLNQTWLTLFGDTSGATALASRFGAELYYYYPNLWPETIKGLIIHSADWTPAMLDNRAISQLTPEEKIKLLQRVGYGVPNMQRARYSANNSLSLIAERVLSPYKKDGSTIKTDEFHLFDLPWPTEVLQELHATSVKLKITLSYFIEPNPGNRKYELSASYRSCGLRFKIIDSAESEAAFKARVSNEMRDDDYQAEGAEDWILGFQVRDKGVIHKDIWEGTAADLSTRNRIAIYPVGGWWKTRKKLGRYNASIRYSLIVTIEAPDIDTDIYTPVLNKIAVEI